VAVPVLRLGGLLRRLSSQLAKAHYEETDPTSAPAARSTAPVADRSLVGRCCMRLGRSSGSTPTPPPPLTRFGEVLLIAVRVLGPLLLGLALLTVRGRVKR
jgi:hypothetical protein